MKNSLETKLGIFVFLAILAAWAIVETLGSADLFRHGYHVTAQFATAQDLKPGDRVKMAGVEIGRVEDIKLTDTKVEVIMKLHDDAMVNTDSKASIKFTGLMGQNFVAIDFGSPDKPQAKEGTELASVEQPDLSAIMTKLDGAVDGIQNMTKTFASDDIHNLFGPLGDFFKSHKDELAATIANVTNITGQIASGQGTVGRLIYTDALVFIRPGHGDQFAVHRRERRRPDRLHQARGDERQRGPGHPRQTADRRQAVSRGHQFDDQPE